MSQQSPPPVAPDDRSKGDPWHAFSYVVAGVAMYGGIGWLLDRWWNTTFLVAIGILFGAAMGVFSTWNRFNRSPPQD